MIDSVFFCWKTVWQRFRQKGTLVGCFSGILPRFENTGKDIYGKVGLWKNSDLTKNTWDKHSTDVNPEIFEVSYISSSVDSGCIWKYHLSGGALEINNAKCSKFMDSVLSTSTDTVFLPINNDIQSFNMISFIQTGLNTLLSSNSISTWIRSDTNGWSLDMPARWSSAGRHLGMSGFFWVRKWLCFKTYYMTSNLENSQSLAMKPIRVERFLCLETRPKNVLNSLLEILFG